MHASTLSFPSVLTHARSLHHLSPMHKPPSPACSATAGFGWASVEQEVDRLPRLIDPKNG